MAGLGHSTCPVSLVAGLPKPVCRVRGAHSTLRTAAAQNRTICLRHTRRCQPTRRTVLCRAQQIQDRDWQRQAAAAVLVFGLRLTAAFQHAADAVRQACHGRRHHQTAQASAARGEAAPQPTPVQLVGATAAAAMVFVQEKADNFVQLMLRMDKPSISLESKWEDLQQLGHEEIGCRMQSLFAASQTASQTAATMLAQTGGTLQASYWQSQETKQVVEEEDALRSAIFCQMLAASS